MLFFHFYHFEKQSLVLKFSKAVLIALVIALESFKGTELAIICCLLDKLPRNSNVSGKSNNLAHSLTERILLSSDFNSMAI